MWSLALLARIEIHNPARDASKRPLYGSLKAMIR